jgi:hypothetical protein
MRLPVLLLALPLLATMIGCLPGTLASEYTVKISPNFTPDEQYVIIAAADAWAAAIPELKMNVVITLCDALENGVICINPDTHADIVSRSGDPNAIETTHTESGLFADNTYTGGWGGKDGGQVFLDTAAPLLIGAEHEMGHAMGLSHTGQGTVMCGNSRCATSDISAIDVAQWRAYR